MTLDPWARRGLVAIAFMLVLAACGGGGIGGTGAVPEGTMNLSIADAPACGYDAVYVTVQSVRVNQSANASDADPGWSQLDLSPPKRVDLLSLTNGLVEPLGALPLPAGTYTQMRLILAANGGSAPFANSVVPSGGSETALTTPSAQQSGLKINVSMVVPTAQVADFVIDFDACKSIVKRGNSGQYNLKPVITVTPVLSAAGMRVIGFVDPAMSPASTSVSVQSAGVPVSTGRPDSSGRFTLYPVPTGTYELVVTSAGYPTSVITGVPVTNASATLVNSATAPIAPSPAGTAPTTVAGTVNPPTASVRALQSLSAGPTVEVAYAAVDAVSGGFSFPLPVAPPLLGAYVANPSALVFSVDTGAAGRYAIEANSNGATQRQAIDLGVNPGALSFTFP